MADLRKGEQPVSWLETELAWELRPVSAPDSLWSRIHEQRRPLRVRPRPWTTWSLAAAAGLILLAGLVWRLGATRDPSADLALLAEFELKGAANGSGNPDFRSGDMGQIQRWVRTNLGVNVRLADRLIPGSGAGNNAGNDAIRLLGARLIRLQRFSAAVITYRVGNNFAAMLVTDRHAGPAGTSGPGHGSLRAGSGASNNKDMLLYSWSQGENDYAIAFGGTKEPGKPCLLCHAGPPALMVLR